MGKNEGVQNVPGISFKEEGDLQEVWRDCTEVEGEGGCRRKLDEKKKKTQKGPREVERLSFASEEMQWSQCNITCKRWRKEGTISRLSTKKVQKRSQKIQSIQDNRKIRKNAWRQVKKGGNSERKLSGRKSASLCCRTKSTKIQWQMRKWKQNVRDCRLEMRKR